MLSNRMQELQRRRAEGTDNGFTLIELLIVIVILGVLAGIVVFAVSAFNGDGVQAACKADMKNVEIAEEALYAKTGAYDTSAAFTTLVPNYMKEAPNSTKYTITFNTSTKTANGDLVGTPVTADCSA